MAKGNTGNLLQHFVALTAASRLKQVAGHFEYVDPFAMAPWEPLDRAEPEFVRLFDSLGSRPEHVVDYAFVAALHGRYPNGRPTRTRSVEYPNTTTLLLHAGLAPARITLCEKDSCKRDALATLLAPSEIQHEILDSWTARLSACRAAALIMLDPYQVQAPRRRADPGYVTVDEIRGLLGSLNLNVLGRARQTAEPCIVTIFSFSEEPSYADETHRALHAEFAAKWGWRVHLVREGMEITSGNRRKGWHQGWWCASDNSVEPAVDLQDAWNTWRA